MQSAPRIPPMTVTEVFNRLIHLIKLKLVDYMVWMEKILKLSARVISDTLTYVYNLCIQKCYVRAAFKQAKVIPLSKSGKNSDPSNYRPIFIL